MSNRTTHPRAIAVSFSLAGRRPPTKLAEGFVRTDRMTTSPQRGQSEQNRHHLLAEHAMKKIPALVLAAVLLAGAAPLHSQNQPRPGTPATPGALPMSNAEIQGTVVESESSTPIPRASITVRSRRDSSIVAGAIASDAGIFRIQGLRPGAYMVRVATIGFKPSVQPVAITDPAQKVALGAIKL